MHTDMPVTTEPVVLGLAGPSTRARRGSQGRVSWTNAHRRLRAGDARSGDHALLAYHPFAPRQRRHPHRGAEVVAGDPGRGPQRSGVALFVGIERRLLHGVHVLPLGAVCVPWPRPQGSALVPGRSLPPAGTALRRRRGGGGPPGLLPCVSRHGRLGRDRWASHGEWLSLGNWPAGPAWFLWLLLAFDIVAAALVRTKPRLFQALRRSSSGAFDPALAFGRLDQPLGRGLPAPALHDRRPPLDRRRAIHLPDEPPPPLRRVLLRRRRGRRLRCRAWLAATRRALERRWAVWLGAALVAFALATAIFIAAFSPEAHTGWQVAASIAFVVSCAAISFALVAAFLRFAKTPRPAFDSLRDNAYGMYLVHHPFCSWLQLALLAAPLPAWVKGLVVFVATVGLSWGAAAALRQVPAIRRVL